MNDINATDEPTKPAPRWCPLNSIDRRVLGVLGEKAKTTPDVYPMSLNGVVTGCNQKSNRAPVLQLEPDQVEESLDRLREMGAVALVEGSGRVQKYRHYLYKWLGVSEVELSVMIELLLRGPQTEGDLRGRVSRMNAIHDLNALRELLASLREKGLVIALTPEGRGQVFTHALYPQRDLEQQRIRYSQPGATTAGTDDSDGEPQTTGGTHPAPMPAQQQGAANASQRLASHVDNAEIEALRQTVNELRNSLNGLQREFGEMAASQNRLEDEIRELKRALGV